MYYAGYNKGGLVQETQRAPSSSIWYDCPVEDLRQSFPGFVNTGQGGILVGDDFVTAGQSGTTGLQSFGQWSCWGGTTTAVAVTDAVEEGGVLKILGATTAHTQFVLSSLAGAFRLEGPTSAFALTGGKWWMECRIAVGGVTTGNMGIFCGFMDNTSSVTGAANRCLASGGDAVATTNNSIGFVYRESVGNDWTVSFCPAGGSVVYPTNLTTLVNTVTGSNLSAYAASTVKGQGTGFVKLGMRFDFTGQNRAIPCTSATANQTVGTLYQPIITFYVNGQRLPTFLAAADLQLSTFPNNCLFAPTFGYDWETGTTAAAAYLDWMYFAQMSTF